MFSIILTIALHVTAPADKADTNPLRFTQADATLPPKLQNELMAKFKTMSSADQGIFHDEVTSIVAPYFPIGQPFAETQRVLTEQGLGSLRHFHGDGDSATSTMYVSRADLMIGPVSNIYVVVDFDFEGKGEADMKLKAVRAFLQAPSM